MHAPQNPSLERLIRFNPVYFRDVKNSLAVPQRRVTPLFDPVHTQMQGPCNM
jgi:hypothetical protein